MSEKNYKKFTDRVCNVREAGFIGIGFVIAVVLLAAIILGIFFGTQCKDDEILCQDGYTCSKKTSWCNGTSECPAGDDEWYCHPTEFYVAFQLQSDITVEQMNDTAHQNTIIAQVDEALKGLKGRNYVSDVKVAYRRARHIHVNGSAYKNDSQTTETAPEPTRVAVDMQVIITRNNSEASASLCDDKAKTTRITPEEIQQAVNDTATFYIHQKGDGVTTGVATVLHGKANNRECRRKIGVFCPQHCQVYQYSSKGCPTYPCVCLTDEDNKNEIKAACIPYRGEEEE